MKIKIAFLATCLVMAFTGIAANPQKPTGRSIMQQVDDRPDGDTRYSQMELTLVKKNGTKRERKVESWAMDVGKDVKKVMFFTYPGDVKGTGFLTWDYDQIGKADDKWLYLPAMKKTRRISRFFFKDRLLHGNRFHIRRHGRPKCR